MLILSFFQGSTWNLRCILFFLRFLSVPRFKGALLEPPKKIKQQCTQTVLQKKKVQNKKYLRSKLCFYTSMWSIICFGPRNKESLFCEFLPCESGEVENIFFPSPSVISWIASFMNSDGTLKMVDWRYLWSFLCCPFFQWFIFTSLTSKNGPIVLTWNSY